MNELKLSFEKSMPGRRGAQLSENSLTAQYKLDDSFRRSEEAKLPEMAEVDTVRHYMALSKRAFGVDDGFYPLGSCTMKYNPKINEALSRLTGFTDIHPLQPVHTVQGCLEVLYGLGEMLNEVSGMDATSLQPAAGAHGEWAGLQLVRAYHLHRGDTKRTKVIVPDSAHGTNPASAAMCGFEVISIKSDGDGYVDQAALAAAMDEGVAALMLTNPNTLGKFEKEIVGISKIVHDAGGLLYYDGANMNAIMGITRPGDMGFDVVHWNLHKTLSAPHGGGGPGSGAVGCKQFLAKYLPVPAVEKQEDGYAFNYNRPDSIGRVKMFYGNFLVCLKAYCYMLSLGGEGLKAASVGAVLNANYMLHALEKYSELQYTAPCMHEFVLDLSGLKKRTGVLAVDVAKSMIDYGIHPPTMYFPLTVHEALMIEPTETESIQTLDRAIAVLEQIFKDAEQDPEKLKSAPACAPVGRPDEVTAARKPVLRYGFDESQED